METHDIQHQKNIKTDVENQTEVQSSSPTSSSSSSPSHDFSFTISLQSSSTPTIFPDDNYNKSNKALDLSPADDIFFHGHLLPLHLLSHFPSSSSPRSSTNSLDNFSLPIKEDDENNILTKESGFITFDTTNKNNNIGGTKVQGNKSKKAFSLFGLTKGRKDKEYKEKHKKKLRFEFDMMHTIKKCLRVFFRGQREKIRVSGKAYSYSGDVTPRNNNKQVELRGWNGNYYSAPASMKGSPTNSGLLFATNTLPPVSDSTMEELQAAIQAAIAHCKNSFSKEEKAMC